MRLSLPCLCLLAMAARADGPAPTALAERPIRAFCIDFNWGPGGINGFAPPGLWADADPAVHVAWYEALGCNTIQTFAVSCNGYAWYRGGLVPEQPALASDFLTEVVRLGHERGMRVMGYFCVASNTRWGLEHPEESYGPVSAPHIPFTTEYLDFLCASIEDALRVTGMDGFMIDWVWNPGDLDGAPTRWLPCEQRMYEELLGEPFPGAGAVTPERDLAFRRRAIDRCWARIRAAAKRTNPRCVIWLSCANVESPSVVDSPLLREVDWLMNEAPDPRSLQRVRGMAGPRTRLVQCVVGWGSAHDARKVLLDPSTAALGIYGFAAPGGNSLPRPVEEYRRGPVGSFEGNDRNIAVLSRAYRGLSLEDVVEPDDAGVIGLGPEFVTILGMSPVVTEGQIGHWGDPGDSVRWRFRVPEAARYEVRLTYACQAGMEGSRLAVRVGSRDFQVTSAATGPTWREYVDHALGTVRLAAGDHTLSLEPSDGAPWHAISVRRVELVPVAR